MCKQLQPLAQVVDVELTKAKILPELLELLNDEEILVRVSAMDSLVEVIDFLPSCVHVEMVLPVLRRHMQPLDLEPEMQRCIARLFGPILVKVTRVRFIHAFNDLKERQSRNGVLYNKPVVGYCSIKFLIIQEGVL